ncbi:EMILIN-1-A isoform X3 [Magallana gigas]|uniref:EMILIN-1-A isoform X3 n=1 Tax=Magallana gigas TaxID=29159 RepID=UPI00333FE408
MMLVCILAIFLSFARADTISSLTDGENTTSTSLESKDQEWNDLSILRQMINQETVIRLALVKNVHALVNDVNLMKKGSAASETTVSGLQQAIEALNTLVYSLQKENSELKNSSKISQAKMMEFETRIQTLNESVSSLYDKVNVNQMESGQKRQEMFNKTNSVISDIKIELRYLSVTLFDFKEHTDMETESRDKKYEELEHYFNISVDELKTKIFQTKSRLSNLTEQIQNVQDFQTEMNGEFTENLNRTVTKFETQFKTSEYERLKLSSTVSSLEVAQMNMSKSRCDVSKRVGFTATLSSASSTWNSATLVFPVVITNVGNGYNPSTGVFTAPTAGEYVFFVNVQSYNNKDIYVDVVLNGVTKVRTMAYGSGSSDYYDAGPNLVVLTLQKGDRVWIKRYSGQGYYIDGPITTFSGFLL